MDLVTYLAFNGQCEDAFRHYEKVLGGRILMLARYADAPTGQPVNEETKHLIMHARLEVDGRLLMGGDAPPPHYAKPQGFSASVQVDTPAEAERIFAGLSEGGRIQMPMAETFWAQRFGMCIDRFGTPWMVNCQKAMEAAQGESEPFQISRTLDAPRDLVWAAFTDEQRMRQWWGPKGYKVTHSRMELKPGGIYHYALQAPDGTQVWGKFVYSQIEAPERIALVSSFSDPAGGETRHPMAPEWPLRMRSTFEFRDAGAGRTEFRVTWSPLDPTPKERAAFEAGRASMQQGWSGTLEQLADYLARQKPSAVEVTAGPSPKAAARNGRKRASKG